MKKLSFCLAAIYSPTLEDTLIVFIMLTNKVFLIAKPDFRGNQIKIEKPR